MTAHPALHPDLVRRLRAALSGGVDSDGKPRRRLKQMLKPLMRRAIGWYVEPALEANVADVRRIANEMEQSGVWPAITVDVELLKAEIAALEARFAALESMVRDLNMATGNLGPS